MVLSDTSSYTSVGLHNIIRQDIRQVFHSHETLPYIVFIFSHTVMLLTSQSVGGVHTYVGWANKLAFYIEGVSISN